MPIRVSTLRPDGSTGYDVTERIEGLQFSNVNPGGHERCTFTLKGEWSSGFPEVRRGNLVIVEDGLKELFTGRIDEQDPAVSDAEQISVTAYGIGVRTKDDTMREIYVDRDLSRWGPASVTRKLLIPNLPLTDPTVNPDQTNGQPALNTSFIGPWSVANPGRCEAFYDANGIILRDMQGSWKLGGNINPGDTNWNWTMLLVGDDTLGPAGSSNFDGNVNLRAAGPGVSTLTATTATRVFAMVYLTYASSSASTVAFEVFWTVLAVYGDHGLTKQGVQDATNCQGFLASQIVADVCTRLHAAGIVARDVDTSDFVIQQLAFLDDATHEDVIAQVSKFHDVDWGVWGANALGDDRTVGYLDWTARDSSVETWTAYRDECDEVDLHTEIGSTFSQVAVSYSDPAGKVRRELRTIDSTALDEAGITARTATLQGGTLDQEGAQQLGDAFLLLSSGNPVSRGSAIISGPVRHISHGVIPAHHMRADGSNLSVPDAFPDRDALALRISADRRSVFPIKRVSVDCSGDKPVTTVELDQTHDLLSILLARLQLGTSIAIGGSG